MPTPRPARRPRRAWLVAAALLLAGSAALLALVEGEPSPPPRPKVRFPSHMRAAEEKRLEARRTLPPLAPPPGPPPPGEPAPEPPPPRDPFLAALPAGPGDAVVVFEANALRHSRLGELFLRCALAKDPQAFQRVEEQTGVDVLKDIDRVAVAGDALVVSGFFDRAHWDRLGREGATSTPLGDAGLLWRPARGRGVLASWGDQLVILSPDERAARRAIDQLEGRAPVPEASIPEALTYGEVYGVIPGAALQRLLGPGQPALGERLAAAASRVELHVDAMQDVAAVVRVEGEPEGLSELARTLGGALAAGRLEAKAKGEAELVELLDAARVQPADGRFSVELALPQEVLERWFERCAAREAPTP